MSYIILLSLPICGASTDLGLEVYVNYARNITFNSIIYEDNTEEYFIKKY